MLSTVSARALMPSLDPPIADEVPWSERVTPYDEAHFAVYIRLLDALAAGAAPDAMARIVLGIDPTKEPSRANSALQSHVKRAQWMTTDGYLQLLERSPRPLPQEP